MHQGYPAFLGLEIAASGTGTGATGAVISGVVSSSPAAAAGLTAGDTIVSAGGTSVASSDGLSAALADRQVGEHISVGWLDASGARHTTTVTLAAGPAD
nr:PDZ domain-containing protein [Pseudonocardia endophytica]